MIKVFDSDSFNFNEPSSRLVEVHSRGVDKGWMKKQAAMFTKEVAELRPEKGYSYIHLISLGAGESVGSNRNGDYFNEKSAEFELPEPKNGKKLIKLAGGLQEYHKMFKKGHVFANHNNDDPKKSIGEIVAETYNEPMRRGELIIKVAHGPVWDKDLEKLANGDPLSFSMACRVPFDICSICGNQARTRQDYCSHLSDNMTMITKEGHQVFAINDRPDFFDISKVFRPADRTAWSLRKVASAKPSGVELAESYGLIDTVSDIKVDQTKQAIADKFAEMEKQIEMVPATSKSLALGCPTGNLSTGQKEKLQKEPKTAALRKLAESKIALSLQDFVHVFGTGLDSRYISEAEPNLPGIFQRMSSSNELADADAYSGAGSACLSKSAEDLISSLAISSSVDSDAAQRRARVAIVKCAGVVDMKERHEEVPAQAKKIASEYAKYLVAFAKEAGLQDDEPALGLTVVRNYLKV